jgi:putative transcriptional regulator
MEGYIEKPKPGDLLISEPFLPDPNFERSVILLCSHETVGSLGFIVNKPTELTMDKILEGETMNDRIYMGGPVQPDTLHFLHTLGDRIQGSQEIASGIHWGGDFEQLRELIHRKRVHSTQYRFILGYSGWGAGQLESELKEKAWIISPHLSNEIFSFEPSQLWRIVLNNMGGKFRMISNYPTDPRLN